MSALSFARPWMLALLWLVPLAAGFLLWRRNRRRSRPFLSPAMEARLAPARRDWRFGVQLALLGLGFALAFIALARPQFGETLQTVSRRGRDLMIVLDVSRSMLAADVAPNRLDRAKADLIDLVNSLGGDRAGLLAFRHRAVPLCPLTTDHGFLLQMLDAAGPDSAPPGETDIGDAILKALAALDVKEHAYQAVILVTDGEDLAGAVDEAVEKAKERGVAIFTVGFGSAAGGAVPGEDGARLTWQGREVTSKLDSATLRSMAARTGGVYVPVGTARADLGSLYREHLRRRSARDMEETVTRRRIERFSWFLLPALLLWLAAALLSAGRPRLGAARAVLLAFLLLPPAARAEDAEAANPARTARDAQSLHRKGRYAEAAELYRKAAGLAGNKQAARDHYNAGCALLRAGKAAEAAEQFRLAGAARGDSDLPWSYNLGEALFEEGRARAATNAAAAREGAARMTEAAAAFQEALRGDEPARREQALNNLSFAGAAARDAGKKARELEIAEKYGSLEAPALAQQLLERQRKLEKSVAAIPDQPSPEQIQQLESAGSEARDLADLLGPLGARLETAAAQSSATNAQAAAAALRRQAEGLAGLLRETGNRLRDADPAVQDRLGAGEQAAYGLWKALAPYEPLLREDLRAQSNLVERTAAFTAAEPPDREAAEAMAIQGEAAELTRLFSRRFAEAVPEGGQPPSPGPDGQPSTNQPGITAETRAKILKLAEEAAAMQGDAVKAGGEKDWRAASLLARDSHRKLKEIEDLLPKQNQQQNQPNPDQQKQDPSKQEQPKQDPQQKQDPGPQEPPKQEPPKPEPGEKSDDMKDDEVRQILRKALQREKEYQDEKRKRAFLERAPGERDW